MNTQHKAIMASAAIALFGVSTAYGQTAQTTPRGEQKAAPQAAESKDQDRPARSAKPEKAKPATLTFAERTLLQERLRSEGFYKGEIDGRMGEPMRNAIVAFQKKHGLTPTGRPNAQTLSALGIMPSLESTEPAATGTTAAAATQQPASAPVAQAESAESAPAPASTTATTRRSGSDEAVQISALSTAQTRAIQEKLRRLGFYHGEIDGMANASTQRALRDYYQSQAQLAEQGKVRADSASAFTPRSDVQRVRGEDEPRSRSRSNTPRREERGLDNMPRNDTENRGER